MRCYARYLRFKSAIDSGPDSTLELDDRDFESGSLGLRVVAALSLSLMDCERRLASLIASLGDIWASCSN